MRKKIRKQGKRYTEEQKVKAVKLFIVKGESAREAAEVVGATEVSVRVWARNRRIARLARAA